MIGHFTIIRVTGWVKPMYFSFNTLYPPKTWWFKIALSCSTRLNGMPWCAWRRKPSRSSQPLSGARSQCGFQLACRHVPKTKRNQPRLDLDTGQGASEWQGKVLSGHWSQALLGPEGLDQAAPQSKFGFQQGWLLRPNGRIHESRRSSGITVSCIRWLCAFWRSYVCHMNGRITIHSQRLFVCSPATVILIRQRNMRTCSNNVVA